MVSSHERAYITDDQGIDKQFSLDYSHHYITQATTIFLTVLVAVFFNISQCNGDTCYCYCCAGNFCTPTLQGTISVSSCASSSCKSVCQNKYPAECTNAAGSANYQCRSGGGSTANWAGTFNMVGRCDTSTCCCPVGQLILSRVGNNALRVQCLFSGQCPGGSSTVDQTIDMPSDFNTQITFMGNPISVTLSQDSRTIQFTNPLAPACSESATRDGPVSAGTINLASVFFLTFLLILRQFII